jgi:hypothetical protein
LSGTGRIATIRGAVGVEAPADTHRVAALLRRIVALTSLIALVLLAFAATGFGAGEDVIQDFQADGQINGCYTDAEFREALRALRADEVLYGNAIEVIQEARATNTAEPGEPCEGGVPVEEASGEDSGSGVGLWLGLAAAVGLIAVGAGLWARRGGTDDGDSSADSPDGDGTGDDPTPPRS